MDERRSEKKRGWGWGGGMAELGTGLQDFSRSLLNLEVIVNYSLAKKGLGNYTSRLK